MERYYKSIHQTADSHEFGCKTVNTQHLVQAGFTVPSGFGIATQCFRDFCSFNGIDIGGGTQNTACVQNGVLPENMLFQFSEIYERMPDGPLAVRSSAVGEDHAQYSGAGIYESVLNVIGLSDFQQAVKDCWSSYFSEKAVFYRKTRGADVSGMGVLVQNMIEGEKSGLVFTVNPVLPQNDEMIIEAYPGLNFAVVDGTVQADRFTVGKDFRILKQEVHSKRYCYCLSTDSGKMEKKQIDKAQSDSPALTEEEIIQVSEIAGKIRAEFGGDWDIEWTIQGNRLYILQARPVTSKKSDPSDGGKDCGSDQIRGNVTAVLLDRFSKPVSRCYASLLKSWENRVYLSFYSRQTGKEIQEKPFLFLYGRVYWNINYQKEYYDDVPFGDTGMKSFCKKVILTLLINCGYRNFYARTRKYDRKIKLLYEKKDRCHSGKAFSDLLKEVINLFCDYIGKDHFRMLGAAQICHALLLKKLDGIDADGELMRRMFALNRDRNLTVVQNREIRKLAEIATRDPEIRAIFANNGAWEIGRMIEERRKESPFCLSFTDFINRFGHRGTTCDDLAEPHWRENPAAVIDLIRQSILQKAELPEQDEKMNARIGIGELYRKIRNGNMPKRLVKAFRIHRLIMLASEYMVLRENQRFFFDKSWLLLRRLLIASGSLFVAEGCIEKPEDIFFLDMDEIHRLCETDSPECKKGLVALRKEEQERYGSMVPPYYFYGGQPMQFQRRHKKSYKAVAISRGKASGPVKIISGINDFKKLNKSDIAVVETFHPSWTPLLNIVSGIIMNYGNMLSHGAVVAREYGIPMVVFNGEATRYFHDGQVLEINAVTGRIHTYDKNDGPLNRQAADFIRR